MFIHSAMAQDQWSIVKKELVFSEPPFRQCHASTLVESKKGKILLACFGGSAESNKDVEIWSCAIDKRGIAKPKSIANGVVKDNLRYPTWNPVFFRTREGKIFLFYKIGPNPREWWGVMKISNDDGKTWSPEIKLPSNILGPIKNKPIQLEDGTILSPSSVEESTELWKVHLEKSKDDGKTWEVIPVDPQSKYNVIQPSILTYPGNRLQILCRSKQGKVIQSWSDDGGSSWSPLSETSLPNPNSGTDAVTLKDGTQLIVYNPDIPGPEWFHGRAKLRVAESKDGITWKDVITLENGTNEEFSYPAIIQSSDGLVHISYTYDRKNIKHVVLKANNRKNN
jgi:predicted neuraminidase